MSRHYGYTEEELAMLTKAEREGLIEDTANESMSERDRHLAWCKGRALEYLDSEDAEGCRDAISSMLSDLRKHPDTAVLASGGLAMIGMTEAASGNVGAVERWIEGFG